MSKRLHGSQAARLLEAPGGSAVSTNVPNRTLALLSLFTSSGTLICCALPSVLVLFGLGATVASFLAAAPWLVTVSRHKGWVFATSGTLLALNVAYVYYAAPRGRAATRDCADDACGMVDRFSRVVLWISCAIYAAGFSAAYVLGPILRRLE